MEARCVLVVDDDAGIRQLVRFGLDLVDVAVIEAETVNQARALLQEHPDGIVLDRQLPDGDGTDLLPDIAVHAPDAVVVIHSSLDERVPGRPAVPKGDVDGLITALGLDDHRLGARSHPAVDLAMRRADLLADAWSELCRWDPAVPVGAEPPVTASIIAAVSAALERPQPLGWGLDPALEPAAEAFGLNVGDPTIALAQLVCLQEAFARHVVEPLPVADQLDALRRVSMIINRTMVAVADAGLRRLARMALVDPLTGVGNRRAFDNDLAAELAHAVRHGGHVTLAVIDVDGLKAINDRQGHPAGDDMLRRTAAALRTAARRGDRTYRLGGDEFAVILRDAVLIDPEALQARLERGGAPPVSIGTATAPPDPPDSLLDLADARLYEGRRARRRTRPAHTGRRTSTT